MQTVSAQLIQEQAQPTQRYYRITELQKRYWNGAAYVWDAVQDISGYVNKISTAKWKLDTSSFNEWKSPSFQIEVDNPRNLWGDAEPTGLWQSGAHGPYVVELSKVKVRCGQYLPDGTKQDLYVFTGVINRPIAFHEQQRTATVSLVGLAEILKRTDATKLSVTTTLEKIGSDSGTDFTTANSTVGLVLEVRKGLTSGGSAAATVLTVGVDYSVSNLSDYTLPATVKLAAALTAGNSVWCTYYTWYKDKDMSWVVTQLLALAPSISSTQVDPTVFANSVTNTWARTTQADFLAGVLQNIDVTTIVDSFMQKWWLLDDFAAGNLANWSVSSFGGSTASGATNAMVLTNPGGNSQVVCDRGIVINTGTVSVDANITHSGSGTNSGAYVLVGSGGLQMLLCFNFSNGRVEICDGAVGTGFRTVYLDCGAIPSGTHNWRVVTNSDNSHIEVFMDNVSVGVSTTWTLGAGGGWTLQAQAISFAPNGGQTMTATFDNFYYSEGQDGVSAVSPSTPVLTSPVLDTGGSLTAFGHLLSTYSPNGGSVLFETLSATDAAFTNPDPAGWVAISVTGQINSAVRRYLKVRATITSSGIVSPVVSDYSVIYYTSAINIQVVNMTNLDVWSAIENIAAMPCYEIGFTANETFFYRARSTSLSPVLVLNKDTNLEKELSFNSGRDQIFNTVTATFGIYAAKVDSNTQGQAHPNSIDRDGVLSYNVPSSSLLPASSANVAQSAALTVWSYTSVARRRAQVQLKFLAQYELGDIVTYQREHKFGRWLWGDPNRKYGDAASNDFVWHADPANNGWDIKMRIEGIEFDTEPGKWRLRYDLAESN